MRRSVTKKPLHFLLTTQTFRDSLDLEPGLKMVTYLHGLL